MKQLSNAELIRHMHSIPGWFSDQDYFIFQALLEYQKTNGVDGNLLEIGAYMGKSSIILGANKDQNENFIVCDLFGKESDEPNALENKNSYNGLTRLKFEKYYNSAIDELPTLLECSSLELSSRLVNHKFRFVHIDGSHLYKFVRNDLDFSITNLVPRGGIIVMDDFRAQHTLGVSKTLWESILNGELHPLVFSAAKVYLVKSNDDCINLTKIRDVLRIQGFQTERVDIFSKEAIRVLGLSDRELYVRNSRITWFAPPFLISIFKKIQARVLR
jgi:hypothetical protein